MRIIQRVNTIFLSCIQVTKKDKPEAKMLTITPSENTHFRVISSTEAVEEREGEGTTHLICGIIKPEPRTIPIDRPTCEPQVAEQRADLSDSRSRFTSEPCPADLDLRPTPAQATRWKSSPPSRRASGSAAASAGAVAEDSAAVCPDTPSKPTDSPVKQRGKYGAAAVVFVSEWKRCFKIIISVLRMMIYLCRA